jgi:mercuric ion transport protein
MPDRSTAPQGEPTRGSGAVLLTLGGLVAAFGVASCCGLPFLLATLGLGTAWLGGFALLAPPHRFFLLAAATICLTGAAILLWRQRAVVCAPGAVCARPAIRGATMIGLIVGLVLLYLGYTYA